MRDDLVLRSVKKKDLWSLSAIINVIWYVILYIIDFVYSKATYQVRKGIVLQLFYFENIRSCKLFDKHITLTTLIKIDTSLIYDTLSEYFQEKIHNLVTAQLT